MPNPKLINSCNHMTGLTIKFSWQENQVLEILTSFFKWYCAWIFTFYRGPSSVQNHKWNSLYRCYPTFIGFLSKWSKIKSITLKSRKMSTVICKGVWKNAFEIVRIQSRCPFWWATSHKSCISNRCALRNKLSNKLDLELIAWLII